MANHLERVLEQKGGSSIGGGWRAARRYTHPLPPPAQRQMELLDFLLRNKAKH